jgi:hypothetical protein
MLAKNLGPAVLAVRVRWIDGVFCTVHCLSSYLISLRINAGRRSEKYTLYRACNAISQDIEIDHAALQDVGVKSTGEDELGASHFRG